MTTKQATNPTFVAAAAERAAFNQAIAAGAKVTLTTFCGDYKVLCVTEDWWYITVSANGYQRTWAGCNDGTWANLLKQAGLA